MTRLGNIVSFYYLADIDGQSYKSADSTFFKTMLLMM
jgi:hypothetical protein